MGKARTTSASLEAKSALTYDKVFWLFMIGNLLGVVIEGTFCAIAKGHWETHVVSVIGHFNILYGSGAVLFFCGAALLRRGNLLSRSFILALVATVLELFCGLFLKHGLGVIAWDYSNSFLNFDGIICLAFSIGWWVAAFAFCLLYPYLDRALSKLRGKLCHILCLLLTAFMVVNLSMTGVAIFRWSARHRGSPPKTRLGELADELAPDDWMQNRFIEWRFIDRSEESTNGASPL